MNRQQKTSRSLPPAILVETLAQAGRAMAVARRLQRAVLLLTAPGAQASLGPAYLLEMMRQAGADRALIDCGQDAGTALLALRLGWRDLYLAGPQDTAARVAAIAKASGATFHDRLPPAFDLAACPPVDEPLVQWLTAHGSN